MLNIIFHIACYNIVWFSCVISAAKGYTWSGLSIAAAITLIQAIQQFYLQQHKNLLRYTTTITVAGYTADSLFSYFGVLSFTSTPFSHYLAPPWMLGLWLNFAFVISACLKAYHKRYVVISIFSLIGFPVAYAAGAQLGAASAGYGPWSFLLLGLFWSLAMPFTLYSLNHITERKK